MSQIKGAGRGKPQQHANELACESLHHLALEFRDIQFAELVNLIADRFKQSPLKAFQ